jgi:hypothetical protein
VRDLGHTMKARMLVILMQVFHVQFEVLKTSLLKTQAFWDVINSQCFEES